MSHSGFTRWHNPCLLPAGGNQQTETHGQWPQGGQDITQMQVDTNFRETVDITQIQVDTILREIIAVNIMNKSSQTVDPYVRRYYVSGKIASKTK